MSSGAREIVRALGGRWHGSYGTACCPCHDDRTPSLSVTDGQDGKLLVHCHAGCDGRKILQALKRPDIGTFCPSGTTPTGPTREEADAERTAAALDIWTDAQPVAGTVAESYLRTRSITLPLPCSLRFVPHLRYSRDVWLPALVAAVQAPQRDVKAVHRTWIDPRGDRKAQVAQPKKALGPLGHGALRLAHAAPVMGLAEGIEDALSAMQMFNVPCWAALGASRLAGVWLPNLVREVIVFADNGTAGQDAAQKAADAFTGQGRRVVVRYPPEGCADWNDALNGREAAA
jgi:phage/plasmid primase-like uncharacterized protein